MTETTDKSNYSNRNFVINANRTDTICLLCARITAAADLLNAIEVDVDKDIFAEERFRANFVSGLSEVFRGAADRINDIMCGLKEPEPN